MLGRSNTGGGGAGGILTVTAPAGVTVEVSKDGKTKRKTSNAEGLAVFKGLATGTWTLTITNGSQTSTQPVVITADYSASISFFSASINVTYPAGSTCTCTDGTTTITAPDTSGTWVCVVPNAGTWTVTCTNGTNTAIRELHIATSGQNEVVEMYYILYLYNAGNEFTDLTGGWEFNTSLTVRGEKNPDPRSKFDSDSIYMVAPAVVNTKEKIDLSMYSNLCFDVNVDYIAGTDRYGVFENFNNKEFYNNESVYVASVKSSKTGRYTIKLDISSLKTSYYVAICTSNELRVVYKVWLE